MPASKICPTCERYYFDDSVRFCLDDGAALVDPQDVKTVVYLSGKADIRIRLRRHLRELQSDSLTIEYSLWDRGLCLAPGSTKKFVKEVAIDYGYKIIEEGTSLLELRMEMTIRTSRSDGELSGF